MFQWLLFSVRDAASKQSGTLSFPRASRFLWSCHPWCLFNALRSFSFAAIQHLNPQACVLKLGAGLATGVKREVANENGAGAADADAASPGIFGAVRLLGAAVLADLAAPSVRSPRPILGTRKWRRLNCSWQLVTGKMDSDSVARLGPPSKLNRCSFTLHVDDVVYRAIDGILG